MIAEADKLKFIQVTSELEALLLEAKLINKIKPKYNSIAKDDKHPLYIVITKEHLPRVITSRKSGDFGPFPSSTTIHYVLRMLRRIFPYADHKIGKHKCIYAHLGLCNPCPNEIVHSTKYLVLRKKYLKNILMIRKILSGKIRSVQLNLEKEMLAYSKNQKFEEASKIRDQIKKLEYITQPIIPSDFYLENPNLKEDIRKSELNKLSKLVKIKNLHRIECYDIAHLSGIYPTASMVVFIDGEPEKSMYRHFRVRQVKSNSDFDSIKEISVRRAKNSWGNPDLIIVDGGVGQVKSFKSKFPVVGIAKNPDRLIVNNQKIKLSSEVLNLVSRIRDEAHRFARRYHHILISKSIVK